MEKFLKIYCSQSLLNNCSHSWMEQLNGGHKTYTEKSDSLGAKNIPRFFQMMHFIDFVVYISLEVAVEFVLRHLLCL